MDKEVVITDHAPAAVGPYSQAVKAGRMVFVSGQLPIDPTTGDIVKGDIRVQTKRVLTNLEATLGSCRVWSGKCGENRSFYNEYG